MERSTDEASGLGKSILQTNGPLSLQDPKREGSLQAESGLQVAEEAVCLLGAG